MGQYWHTGFKNNGKIFTSARRMKCGETDDCYIGAKLMEHSWIHNWFMNSVANYIFHNPTNILWCGDYADEGDEVKNFTYGDLGYEDIWGDNELNPFEFDLCKSFDYSGKYLVNHTKKVCISFDDYIKKSTMNPKWADGTMCINPISLLTAVGNGRGGGDYYGENECMVGTWVWDLISIETDIPKDYKIESLFFAENYD